MDYNNEEQEWYYLELRAQEEEDYNRWLEANGEELMQEEDTKGILMELEVTNADLF